MPRGDRPGAGRRGRRLAADRRRGARQGAGPVRGRDDARAVPRRRARRHRQAAAAGAHGGLGRRRDRDRGDQPGPRRRAPAGARGRVREAVRVQRHVGAVHHTRRSPCRSAPARAGTSPRTSAPTSAASGAPAHIGAMVAVKDRRNGGLNPYAHLRQPDITLESVQASTMLWDPIRYDETCPSSDGACAVVIGDQAAAEASDRQVAWIRATAMRTEPTSFAGKDHVNPRAGREAARGAVARSRHHRPARRDRRRRDLRAVLLVRADVAGEPRLRRARARLEAHRGRRDPDRRQAAGQPVRRGALLQPDRRLRPAALRRGGACR